MQRVLTITQMESLLSLLGSNSPVRTNRRQSIKTVRRRVMERSSSLCQKQRSSSRRISFKDLQVNLRSTILGHDKEAPRKLRQELVYVSMKYQRQHSSSRSSWGLYKSSDFFLNYREHDGIRLRRDMLRSTYIGV